MPMTHPSFKDSLGEPLGKFTAVIGLQSKKRKRSRLSRFLHKRKTSMRVDGKGGTRIRPATADIKKCVDIHGSISDTIMNGVNFHQASWSLRHWSWGICMPLFPLGETTQIVSPQDSFDGRKRDLNPVSLE